MKTDAIQRLIDRAHVANNEPTRLDAKEAQRELDYGLLPHNAQDCTARSALRLMENVACGCAFDAGMREAEQASMRAFFYSTIDQMHEREAQVKAEHAAAIAAERARCLSIAYHHDADEEALKQIESGAPAPRE